MGNIKITYNGNEYEYPKNIKLIDIAKDFQKDFKHQILTSKVNNVMMGLESELVEDAKVRFYDISRSNGNRVYERTAIFILSPKIDLI